MRIGGVVCTALVVAVLGVPDAAARPADQIVMTASGGRQNGTLSSYAETKRTRDGCTVREVRASRERPDPVTHDGSRLVWRLPDKRPPASLSLTVERSPLPPQANRIVTFTPERLRFTLEKVVVRGRVVAWDVVSNSVGKGDIDVTLEVTWRASCGEDSAVRVYRVWAPHI